MGSYFLQFHPSLTLHPSRDAFLHLPAILPIPQCLLVLTLSLPIVISLTAASKGCCRHPHRHQLLSGCHKPTVHYYTFVTPSTGVRSTVPAFRQHWIRLPIGRHSRESLLGTDPPMWHCAMGGAMSPFFKRGH